MKPFEIIVGLFILITLSQCDYRKEAYRFFDRFIFNDLLDLYKKQLFTKTCSFQDGPNCYQISSSQVFGNTPDIQEAMDYFGDRIDLDLLSDYVSKGIESFKQEHKDSIPNLKIMTQMTSMNLLLTFETYDEAAKAPNGMYIPQEKIVHFNVGFIKMLFIGKLLLKNNLEKSSQEPQNTFGTIEGDELLIQFDKPTMFNFVYVRPMKKDTRITITGYSKDKEIYHITQNIPFNQLKWTKVLGRDSIEVDAIKLPGNIMIDNLSITRHEQGIDSDNDQIGKIIQKAIDKVMTLKENNNLKDYEEIIIDDL